MSRLSRQRGKSGELAIAKFWGMVRNHFEASDLRGHPILSIECKVRSNPIMTLLRWMSQARMAAPQGKVPIVHFHVLGDRRENDLIIMKAKDLRDIVGRGEANGK
jgi:hypothetical protein